MIAGFHTQVVAFEPNVGVMGLVLPQASARKQMAPVGSLRIWHSGAQGQEKRHVWNDEAPLLLR